MMALIGFGIVALLGIFLVLYALAAALVSAGFSGNVEWPAVIVPGGIGGALLWYAWTNAPFTIQVAA